MWSTFMPKGPFYIEQSQESGKKGMGTKTDGGHSRVFVCNRLELGVEFKGVESKDLGSFSCLCCSPVE